MKIAIVHYWLLNWRGGEKVLEAICRLAPGADIFTLFYDPNRVTPAIRSHHITTSFLQPLRRMHRWLLPAMPMALENFDLREYDLVISSESGPAKGIIAPSRARHVCYCHTPLRYLWDLYPAYRNDWTHAAALRAAMTPVSNYLRLWDYASAARVDDYVANSRNVQRRIWKTYRRESTVVYPPVAVESFYWRPAEDYYLIVSELVPYKRLDSAVRGCSALGRKLRIVGHGPEYKSLKKAANGAVEFCGRLNDEDLRDQYARCRAFLMPGEEDFGIAAVEALASGKPVIALSRGGALESVPTQDPLGGVFFDEPSDDALRCALEKWDAFEDQVDPQALRGYAARFSEAEFARRMRPILFPD